MMVDVFSANLAPDAKPTRERALALVALCIGGMVLARAVDDDRFSDELREAARRQVLASSGWDTPAD
jgi:TetR/AcrR family transcriptional regulator, transcriptional repressor for nem operon